ncbi:hypothetical protein RINTHH_5840 [Richelia intracellularis HH01]|uniref:Uncharacterized protein n=1 Tax=Richelia intracellularis HH01 TaxID=1165094 RepID=M1WR60_9NOST|nr:hypothetical protein RINTHH_5840 [Richelia intracellularis HH01]
MNGFFQRFFRQHIKVKAAIEKAVNLYYSFRFCFDHRLDLIISDTHQIELVSISISTFCIDSD